MHVLSAKNLSEGQASGVVAQLGERLNGIQEAASSILASSTRNKKGLSCLLAPLLFLALESHPDKGKVLSEQLPAGRCFCQEKMRTDHRRRLQEQVERHGI
jgi:hypothetical protein